MRGEGRGQTRVRVEVGHSRWKRSAAQRAPPVCKVLAVAATLSRVAISMAPNLPCEEQHRAVREPMYSAVVATRIAPLQRIPGEVGGGGGRGGEGWDESWDE